jgi:hypothetical protein
MRKFVAEMIVGGVMARAGSALAQVYATIDTSGVLKSYTVQKNGKTVCKDPTAYVDFRGQGSFIICD